MHRPGVPAWLLVAALAGCDGTRHGPGRVMGADASVDGDVIRLDAPRGDAEDAGAAPRPYVQGINLTRNNPNWTGQDVAVLASMTGASGVRVALPEGSFASSGPDVQALLDHGFTTIIGVLGGPTRLHSTAPATVADAELDRYIPANLQRPFMDAAGNIPIDNYWAAYVYRVVLQYGEAIHIWQVWDEPDAEATPAAQARWAGAPPSASELPRLHGSIFDYVRMLRITRAVARALDPGAVVLAGGIDSAQFLAAAARYSDDPAGGAVSDAFPATGASYFDAVGFRHFPAGAVTSDGAADAFIQHLTALRDVLGPGAPDHRLWFVTATGASHVALADAASGPVFARNYAMKVVTRARGAGLDGLFWHQLSDTAAEGTSTDPADFAGLFLDVEKLAAAGDAQRNDTAEAYRSMSSALAGVRPDTGATAALGLPPEVCGQAFRDAPGTRIAVLWACGPAGVPEGAAASYRMPAQGPVTVRRWDWVLTREVQSIYPSAGFASLPLTSSPVIVAGE